MPIFILFITLTFSQSIVGQTLRQQHQEAFEKFYNSQAIESIYCGKNVAKFVAQHLPKLKYRSAYVVQFWTAGELQYFYGRWGRDMEYVSGMKTVEARWTNGKPYTRDVYHHHVFLVVDGRVLDFSSAEPKLETLSRYLRKHYLPPKGYTTKHLAFSGVLDERSLLSELRNTKLNIIPAIHDEWGDLPKESAYKGKAIDLFKAVGAHEPATKRSIKLAEVLDSSALRRPQSFPKILRKNSNCSKLEIETKDVGVD